MNAQAPRRDIGLRYDETENKARQAMKFVRVALEDGYLTDISIGMLIVELRRRGLSVTVGNASDHAK